MKKLSVLSALVLGALTASAQTATDTAHHVTLDTVEVTAPAGPPVYRGSAEKVWEINNTKVALSFNWKEKTADAKEWVKLRPYFYATDTLVMDAKGMRIDTVQLVGKKGNTKLDYTYENDVLKIRFKQAYQKTDTIELYIKYTAMPYAIPSGGSTAITDDRGLYFINTDFSIPNKAAQIWTQGETESNSHWMVTIDRPNTRFTTQIELTVPDSVVTLSNGAMIKQVKEKGGMRTDIWKMDKPIQAYAVMFAIGKFSIVKDHWRTKEVNYYVEPEYAPSAKLMFNHTPEMIEYFSQRTGIDYPWNKYDQVVVRDYVSGAMENTTASLFGEFLNQDAREIADKNSEDVVSHELFHQWFGDYVTCESWSNLTLNESFANYGEQLWRAHKYGKASGDELSYTDLQGYLTTSQSNDPQLVRFNYDSREEMFDAISYNKGGAILRYLNNLTGDAAFDRAMNIYLTKNALHSAEAHNWRMAVEEVTGQDWNWFFNEWYYHAGHPVVKIVYNYNDTLQQLTVAINQVQSDSIFNYQLPLKAALIYGSNKTIIDWNITKRKDTLTYAYKNGVRPVIVPDCTHILPGSVKDGKKPAQWISQFMNMDDYISKRLAVSAAANTLSDSNSQVIMDMALNDAGNTIRSHALSQLSNTQSDKYRKRWTPKVIAMAESDTDRLVRSVAFEVLGSWKVATPTAKQIMAKAVFDSSYEVASEALTALKKVDKDTAYILAKKTVTPNPRAHVMGIVWTVMGEKGADEDISIYESKAPYLFGSKKFSIAFSINSYAKNVKSDASFTRAIAVEVMLVNNESVKSYRTMFGGVLFQIAGEEKGNLKSEDKEVAATAQKRLDIVKAAIRKIVDAEKDPEALKNYKKQMKTDLEMEN